MGDADASREAILQADRATRGVGELRLTVERHGKRIEFEIELVAGGDR